MIGYVGLEELKKFCEMVDRGEIFFEFYGERFDFW